MSYLYSSPKRNSTFDPNNEEISPISSAKRTNVHKYFPPSKNSSPNNSYSSPKRVLYGKKERKTQIKSPNNRRQNQRKQQQQEQNQSYYLCRNGTSYTSPSKISKRATTHELKSPSKRYHKVNFHPRHHPEYHFFSPKYKQDRHVDGVREDGKAKHRRQLSLEKRQECYEFMEYLQHVPIETGNRILLPPKLDDKPTLVLDLDETLVHCSTMEMEDCHFAFPATFHGKQYHIQGKKRPNCDAFLKEVAKHWEVVVFTASTSVYADQVVDILDPKNRMIKSRLFRDSCTCVEGNYIKDLSCLGRDLKRTVIVDNSPQVFSLQITNGIPIESWYENDQDVELKTLLNILNDLREEEDMRDYIEYEFQVPQIIANLVE